MASFTHSSRAGGFPVLLTRRSLRALREEAERRHLDLPIGVDGGVKEDTISAAYGSGGDVLVVGSGLYRHPGDLGPVVTALRDAARSGIETTIDTAAARS